MLGSAISQPLQTFDNMELYPGIVDKAVRLGYGLITNHPFVDGIKRIGTHSMLVTLDINGIELQYQDEDLIHLILKITSGKADDNEAEISRKELARSSTRQFLDTLGKQKKLVTEFDAAQFHSLVDFITVYSKDDIRVTFRNGMEISA